MTAERFEQYGTLAKGDVVKVTGLRGTFEVVYVDVHDNERPAEVTIIGGTTGRRHAWRTIVIDRIKKQRKPRETP